MHVIIQCLLGYHWFVANHAGVLKSAGEVNVFYMVHKIVLLGPSLSTDSALKKTHFLTPFLVNVLEQNTSIIPCK